MIKVKKSWRKAEEDILKACQNLPPGVKLGTGSFGNACNGSGLRAPSEYMCPLGVRIIGSKHITPMCEVIGTTPDWVEGFWNGVDRNGFTSGSPNDYRAGYQAGRRVAKKVGL